MKKKIILMGMFFACQMCLSTSFGQTNSATMFKGTGIILGGTNTGSYFGNDLEATGTYCLAGGAQVIARGHYSAALGSKSYSIGNYSFAQGYRTNALGMHSLAFGRDVEASQDHSIIFGAGILAGTGLGNDIVNNIENSFMVGFNSNIPSFYVGTSDGLNTTGRVGIGTVNTPTVIGGQNIDAYRLFVAGGILADEVRVRTGWADYVFAPEYELPTLHEVSAFIDENGHLPNVPSAQQVEEEGIEIGDITRIQQEKIEELTLYLIELQKQMDDLKARLDEKNKN